MVGNPHRAQISRFELFELKFLNSSSYALCILPGVPTRRCMRSLVHVWLHMRYDIDPWHKAIYKHLQKQHVYCKHFAKLGQISTYKLIMRGPLKRGPRKITATTDPAPRVRAWPRCAAPRGRPEAGRPGAGLGETYIYIYICIYICYTCMIYDI